MDRIIESDLLIKKCTRELLLRRIEEDDRTLSEMLQTIRDERYEIDRDGMLARLRESDLDLETKLYEFNEIAFIADKMFAATH